MVELAKIEKVELRKVWSNEAIDFTPWLEENMDQLGKALGMDLEVQEREASVGTFSLDLLVHDGNGRTVIIENQLEATDHSHLGQLLTYAAGFDASVIVWITREFRDEHRAALDFLNSRTGEDTEFFGVVVELWKIGESLPAVNFDIVVAPNDWRKQTVAKSQGGAVSERNERYREFFQPLIDTLREVHHFTGARKAQPQNWYSFSAGYRGVKYEVAFQRRGKEARVHLYIDNGDQEWNDQLLDQLTEHKDSIEARLGELVWESLDNRRACRVAATQPGAIEDNDKRLEEIREWMVERLLAFKRVFGPILAELVE